jgi:hypothetical protein
MNSGNARVVSSKRGMSGAIDQYASIAHQLQNAK